MATIGQGSVQHVTSGLWYACRNLGLPRGSMALQYIHQISVLLTAVQATQCRATGQAHAHFHLFVLLEHVFGMARMQLLDRSQLAELSARL